MRPRIMLLGLPRDHPKIQDHIRAQLDAVVDQMSQLQVDFRLIGTTPQDGSSRLKEELASEPVDGVVIGYGIRGLADHTVWFEQLVSTVREDAPGAKLIFNTLPGNTADAVKRWFSI